MPSHTEIDSYTTKLSIPTSCIKTLPEFMFSHEKMHHAKIYWGGPFIKLLNSQTSWTFTQSGPMSHFLSFTP